jgi:hypothetical protein
MLFPLSRKSGRQKHRACRRSHRSAFVCWCICFDPRRQAVRLFPIAGWRTESPRVRRIVDGRATHRTAMHAALAAVLFALASAARAATPPSLAPDPGQLDRLATLPVGGSLVVDGVPDGYGGSARVRFERIDVYAAGARIVAIDADGEHELPRSRRIELIGRDADGAVRVSLGFDPGFANVRGAGSAPSGAFVLTATSAAAGARLDAVPASAALPAGIVPETIAGDDALPSGAPEPLALALAGPLAPAAARVAVVAIDTDTSFMTLRFSGNTTAATNWIADLFATMNAMYQRDLDVTLQQGTTFLRTGSDPYTQSGSPAGSAHLNEFGAYWQANYANVPRTFAALLSGKSGSANSASGIAWVNSYCRTASTGGSYSVNQIFTNPQIGVDLSARIVGHELGHNFGARHTHCTSLSGAAPVAANTIDQCYSGETGCYAGTTSCPVSGPGAPAGSVMSYCNLNRCGPTGQNVLQFHPVQVTQLRGYIAAQPASCMATSDAIFRSGFE